MLVNLAGYQHDEGKTLLLIVILKHEIIEIFPVLYVLVEGFDAPSLLVIVNDVLSLLLTAGLQDKSSFAFSKPSGVYPALPSSIQC